MAITPRGSQADDEEALGGVRELETDLAAVTSNGGAT
jgi:hypothetical protein